MTTFTSKPVPAGWNRITASVYYQRAGKAIDFLVEAFGFDVRLRIEGEGGRIEHSELVIGDGMIMVGDEKLDRADRKHCRSPASLDGQMTQGLMVFVDDVDAHCAHARARGATIATEPKTSDYGDDYWVDRTYEAVDLEGHHWYFCQRLKG